MGAFEINIPAIYVELLDAAASRVSGNVTTDFRKRLLMYYVNRYVAGRERISELPSLVNSRWLAFTSGEGMPNKRLSMKLNEAASVRISHIQEETKLSKTDLVKSLVEKFMPASWLPSNRNSSWS